MSQKIIINAITAVLALGVSATPIFAAAETANTPQVMDPSKSEKCYGIAKAGQNDCSAANHGCSGESKIAGDKSQWLYVPTGLCNKIVGGSLTPVENGTK